MGVVALEEWCRRQLAGYPAITVRDMSTRNRFSHR